VAFLTPSWDALFAVNRLIDLIFLKDMAMNLCTKRKLKKWDGSEVWVRADLEEWVLESVSAAVHPEAAAPHSLV